MEQLIYAIGRLLGVRLLPIGTGPYWDVWNRRTGRYAGTVCAAYWGFRVWDAHLNGGGRVGDAYWTIWGAARALVRAAEARDG